MSNFNHSVPCPLAFTSANFTQLYGLPFFSSRATKMAARLAATRQATYLSLLSSSKITAAPPSIVHRRGFAGGGDHHGPQKVNFWQEPLSPSRWKEEHFVIVSLAGWGALIYGGYKFFTKDKNKNKDEVVGESPK